MWIPSVRWRRLQKPSLRSTKTQQQRRRSSHYLAAQKRLKHCSHCPMRKQAQWRRLFALAVASTVPTWFRPASIPQPQPPKLRLECSVFAGMNIAERIQQTRRTLAQFLPRLGKSTGICIVSMAMLSMPVDVNAPVQPTPEIILYGTDTVRKHIYEQVAWGIPLIVGREYWRFVSIESHKTYESGSMGCL